MSLSFPIELDREDGGRWIAEIGEVSGALWYGKSQCLGNEVEELHMSLAD